jgi:hypothetical protein
VARLLSDSPQIPGRIRTKPAAGVIYPPFFKLIPGDGAEIDDSEYREVGRWAIYDSPEPRSDA